MTQQWKQKFYLNFEESFSDKTITRYDDGSGYSLIDEYSVYINRMMGLKGDGNQVPFFKIYLDEEDIVDNKYVPLIISVALTSVVHEGGNTRYMLNDSRVKHLKPIEYTSREDFYVSKEDGNLYRRVRKSFKIASWKIVYKRLYSVHISNILTISGFIRRARITLLRKLPSTVLRLLSKALSLLIYGMKGENFKYNVIEEMFRNQRNDVRTVTPQQNSKPTINFFGYMVEPWSLYAYSIVVIILCITLKDYFVKLTVKDSPIDGILTIVLGIFSIITFDQVLPRIIRLAIKYSSIWSYRLKYAGVRIKV